LAGVPQEQATPELRLFFDQSAVPALLGSALQGKDLAERLQAVMILRQVNSPASRQAIETLRRNAKEEAIQRALLGSN
jgi:hypothetical protein